MKTQIYFTFTKPSLTVWVALETETKATTSFMNIFLTKVGLELMTFLALLLKGLDYRYRLTCTA